MSMSGSLWLLWLTVARKLLSVTVVKVSMSGCESVGFSFVPKMSASSLVDAEWEEGGVWFPEGALLEGIAHCAPVFVGIKVSFKVSTCHCT